MAGKAPGHIESIISAIAPAAKSVQHLSGDRYYNAERANAKLVARNLRSVKPIIEAPVTRRTALVVPAIYNLGSGQVQVL